MCARAYRAMHSPPVLTWGGVGRQIWINTGDIVLVGLRDFQDGKADVIMKYSVEEARSLKAYGELPDHAKINETDATGEGEDGVEFDFNEDDIDDI
jgi:translation initiation factor 1A